MTNGRDETYKYHLQVQIYNKQALETNTPTDTRKQRYEYVNNSFSYTKIKKSTKIVGNFEKGTFVERTICLIARSTRLIFKGRH